MIAFSFFSHCRREFHAIVSAWIPNESCKCVGQWRAAAGITHSAHFINGSNDFLNSRHRLLWPNEKRFLSRAQILIFISFLLLNVWHQFHTRVTTVSWQMLWLNIRQSNATIHRRAEERASESNKRKSLEIKNKTLYMSGHWPAAHFMPENIA